MKIYIASGLGSGPTELASFDAALNNAGVANYNLLKLSSIIPPKTIIKQTNGSSLPGQWGDRLYVVMAEKRVDTANVEAWAGLGWVQNKVTGKGLFVEHTGESEKSVRRAISQTLEAMMATRNVDFGEVNMKIVGKTCTNLPVCVLVVAVYQASDWENQASFVK